MDWRERIILDPQVLAGKPVVRGTRLSVEFVLSLLAEGWKMFAVSDVTVLKPVEWAPMEQRVSMITLEVTDLARAPGGTFGAA